MTKRYADVLPRALPIGRVWRMMSQDVAWRYRSSWSKSDRYETRRKLDEDCYWLIGSLVKIGGGNGGLC